MQGQRQRAFPDSGCQSDLPKPLIGVRERRIGQRQRRYSEQQQDRPTGRLRPEEPLEYGWLDFSNHELTRMNTNFAPRESC